MSPDHDTDPIALADRDVRRLLPPEAGLCDPGRLRPRLAVLLETLYGRVLAAEAEARSFCQRLCDLQRAMGATITDCMDADDIAFARQLRQQVADLENENDQLQRMIQGHEKAYALLLAGMGESEEQRTALKLRVRELEAAEGESARIKVNADALDLVPTPEDMSRDLRQDWADLQTADYAHGACVLLWSLVGPAIRRALSAEARIRELEAARVPP